MIWSLDTVAATLGFEWPGGVSDDYRASELADQWTPSPRFGGGAGGGSLV